MTKMVDISTGELDTLIEIQSQGGFKDQMGGRATDWTTVYEAWAKVQSTKARERIVAGKVTSETYHQFYVRFDAGVQIEASMRVRYVDPWRVERTFSVESVVDLDKQHVWLELHCIENKAA